jgi:tRNA(Ile)-lysidine synthase
VRSLEAAAHGVLSRRLRAESQAPIAVAVSGGGDSVALALIAAAWAAEHGRRILLLNVDHGLQPQSAGWADFCGELALRLGAEFRPLRWTGEKPGTGLPATARMARHRLLADAARQTGARAMLVGHTAADRAEAAAMRAEGSNVPDPREWSPSPAWPEGRGLFLLRPLIEVGRAEIRAWLTARGESWIEDPANRDLRFARARARAAGAGSAGAPPAPAAELAELARRARCDAAGVLTLPRERLRGPQAAEFIAMACLCAAGTARPPRGARLARLAERLSGAETVVATLGGARIEADAAEVRFLRDAGEATRGGLAEQVIAGPGVWDGRFGIAADRPVRVRRLQGLAGQLAQPLRTALKRFPAAARPGLPALVEGGVVACPLLDPVPGVEIRALAYERLLAASGAVACEP